VIGCDGIKSRVRQLVLGEDSAAAYSHYSHKYAFRALVPMDKAVDVLGHYKSHNQHMHMGPKAHLLTFPVAGHTLMNVVAFVTDPNDWSSKEKMTAPATKEEVVKAFASWGPAVRAITQLLPDELDKWGIFDTYEHPAPTYTQGRVCLAGDAAHASSPHHGGGAGIGVEDALTLVSLIERVRTTVQTGELSMAQAIKAAFAAYDPVRRERTQWFVESSRQVCETYEWNNPDSGNDTEKCYKDIRWRSHKLWHFDLDYMMGEAGEVYRSKCESLKRGEA
jgi:salicylate hydroxylase